MADAQLRREQVLRAIEALGGSALLADLVEQTGLHPNTLRGHLDVLEAAHAIDVVTEPAAGRGRPRHRYVLGTPGEPYAALAAALGQQLADVDTSVAIRAAQHWSSLVNPPAVAHNPDEAVAEVAKALDDLGFRSAVSPVGDSITLSGCPYAQIVDAAPVICEIHAALVAELLASTGQDVELESMEVWTTPESCVARLRRPDRKPARIVTLKSEDKVERSAS